MITLRRMALELQRTSMMATAWSAAAQLKMSSSSAEPDFNKLLLQIDKLGEVQRHLLLRAISEKSAPTANATHMAPTHTAATHATGLGDQKAPSHASSSATRSTSTMPRASLRTLFLTSAIPFVAFGFLDNSIMILCGEKIDALMGARLSLTTLASAGLGNLIADVVGVTAAKAIESGVKRLPLTAPRLSPDQEGTPDAAFTRFWGSVIGVTIGCVFGLAPLFIRGTFFSSSL